MEDISIRTQPLDDSSIINVDSSLMRMCISSVLIHSVSVRKLPDDLSTFKCAVTISVNGTSYTTPAMTPVLEGVEKDVVTGNRSKPSGPSKLYKVRFDSLNLLFPGQRRSSRRNAPPPPPFIANPREMPDGVKVTLHSEDLNHVFGTTTCKGSGEAAYMSYPRGEAVINFRVYPVVDGQTHMTPHFNRQTLAQTYLNGVLPPEQPAAIESAAEAAPAEAVEETAAPAAEEEAAAAAPVQEEEQVEAAATGEVPPPAVPEEAPAELFQAPAESEETAAAAEAAAAATAAVEVVANASATSSGSSSSSLSEQAKISTTAAEAVAAHVAQLQKLYAHSSPDPLTAAMRAIVPCFNEAQITVAFALYDTEKIGVIKRQQLIHFVRAHQAYSDSYADDEELLKSLAPYIPLAALLKEAAAEAAAKEGTAEEAAAPVVMEEEEEKEEGEEEEEAVAVAPPAPPRRDVQNLYYHPSNPDAPVEINKKFFTLIAYRLARA